MDGRGAILPTSGASPLRLAPAAFLLILAGPRARAQEEGEGEGTEAPPPETKAANPPEEVDATPPEEGAVAPAVEEGAAPLEEGAVAPTLEEAAPSEEEAPSSAEEEAPGTPAAPPPPGPRLPVLIQASPAAYPTDALKAHLEGEVLLQIDVSETGEVLAIEVSAPAGHGFDEAAAEAVRFFTFEPAQDEAGEAVPARIEYRYRFTLDAIHQVSVEGVVRAAGSREPLPEAFVLLTGPEGETRRAITDAEGHFRVPELAPGTWTINASAGGYGVEETTVEVEEGTAVEATLFLRPDRPWATSAGMEVIEVVGYRMQAEVTERRLDADELRVVPGVGGDIVRAMQTMPGVARTPYNSGQLLVRGTAPADSGFYLGGQRMPLVYHFGGISTVVAGDLLEEVEFFPGGYGVRYGGHMGGVVDMRPTLAPPERSHGYLSADLFQASGFHTQKIGQKSAITLSLRQSYIHALLAPIVNGGDGYSVRLPQFRDAQLRAQHRTSNGSTVDAILLLSDDRFSLQVQSDDEPDGWRESEISIGFTKLYLSGRPMLGNGWALEVSGIVGPDHTRAEYDAETAAHEEALRGGGRIELNRPVPEGGHTGWRLGIEIERVTEEYLYDMSAFDDVFAYREVEEGRSRWQRGALYLEEAQRQGIFTGTLGVRLDGYQVEEVSKTLMGVDPRLAARVEPREGTALLASVGRYSQLPLLREILEVEDLNPQWALQTTLGVEQRLPFDLSVQATGWYSALFDLVSGREDRFEFALAPPPQPPIDTEDYANEGVGRTFGGEALVRYQTAQTFAWVGITLSRSTRKEREDSPTVLFEYDQPIVLNVVGSHALPKGWRVGGRFRYGSGNPFTPVSGRIYDLDTYSWAPIWVEKSERMPSWWSFDLRIDKDWTMKRWTFTTYLDLMNATNHTNVELINWSRDYSKRLEVYGLPIIPALGLKGAW